MQNSWSRYVLIACTAAALCGVLLWTRPQAPASQQQVSLAPSAKETSAPITAPRSAKVAPPIVSSASTQTASTAPTSSVAQPGPTVELAAGTSDYQIPTTGTTSVIAVMEAARTQGFVFASREYPGLGTFITGIDGIENSGAKYWTLYINNKQSPLGASMATVRAGDVISWKYE